MGLLNDPPTNMTPDLSQVGSSDLNLQALKLLAQPDIGSPSIYRVMLTRIVEELAQRGGNVIDRINRMQRDSQCQGGQVVSRRAHNPEIAGSIPAPATISHPGAKGMNSNLLVGERAEYADSYRAQLFGKVRIVEILSNNWVKVQEESGDNRIWAEYITNLHILGREDIPYHP